MKKESKKAEETIDKLLNEIDSKRKAGTLGETEKKKLLKKILFWASEFSKFERFKRYLKAVKDDELLLLCSKWGHVQDETSKNEKGKWSFVTISKNGDLKYRACYKTEILEFDIDKNSAYKIRYDCLKKLNNIIFNEKYLEDMEYFLKCPKCSFSYPTYLNG